MNTFDSILSAATASLGLLAPTAIAAAEDLAADVARATPCEYEIHLRLSKDVGNRFRVAGVTMDGLDLDATVQVPPAEDPRVMVVDLDYGLSTGYVVFAPSYGSPGRARQADPRWTVRYTLA